LLIPIDQVAESDELGCDSETSAWPSVEFASWSVPEAPPPTATLPAGQLTWSRIVVIDPPPKVSASS
jgi:hypothetical protein